MAKATSVKQFHGKTSALKKPGNFTAIRGAFAATTVISLGIALDNLPEALAEDEAAAMMALYFVIGGVVFFCPCCIYWAIEAVRHFRRGDACEIDIVDLSINGKHNESIVLKLRNTSDYYSADDCQVKLNAFERSGSDGDAHKFIGRLFLTTADFNALKEREVKSGDFSINAGETEELTLMRIDQPGRDDAAAGLHTQSFYHLGDRIPQGLYSAAIGVYGGTGKKTHEFQFQFDKNGFSWPEGRS